MMSRWHQIYKLPNRTIQHLKKMEMPCRIELRPQSAFVRILVKYERLSTYQTWLVYHLETSYMELWRSGIQSQSSRIWSREKLHKSDGCSTGDTLPSNRLDRLLWEWSILRQGPANDIRPFIRRNVMIFVDFTAGNSGSYQGLVL